MKTLGVILLAVALGQLAVGSRAMAQQPAPPDPYTAPPPTYGSAPPAYSPPPMTPGTQFMMYESTRKNAGLAVVLEIFIPGLGSLYGDHAVGSLITWGLMIAGIAMLVYGVTQLVDECGATSSMCQPRNESGATFGLIAGAGLMLGGRIYGLVDSYMSTEEYNRKLRARFGLPVVVNFGLGKVGGGTALSFGPRLTVAF
jgi:hypothetical protein